MLMMLVPLGAAEPDWKKIEAETLDHFVALLRMDTSSPPGKETVAAEYLRRVLEREGIPVKVLAKDPERANVIARLKGTGKKRPLLILGHTDVVGVQRDKWKVDPFGGVRENGYIRGRGTVDDKDNLVACLMVMLTLKRMNVALDRDVIFLAEADEESSAIYGAKWLVEEHFSEIEAEFAFAEGGGGQAEGDRLLQFTIATAEKVPRRLRLVARGVAGHGSMPRPDNAVAHLAAAVGKVAEWLPPMRLNDTTRTYFEKLALASTPEARERYNSLTNPEKTAAVQEYLRKNEFMHSSMLRTSISPTVIQAGFRENVIPSEAEATLDVRALPDEDMDAFVAELKRIINDPAVEIERANRQERPAGAPSRLDTEAFAALEAAQRKVYPGTVTLPTMMTGATDMSFLRAKGIQSYGLGPVTQVKDRFCCGSHSDDEKILEADLHRFVRFFWEAVTGVAGAK
jgi:acetylornithine deacetylase/succinyl-diaminopimelate desuccinylase-like protein